jgi:hypothetical protein
VPIPASDTTLQGNNTAQWRLIKTPLTRSGRFPAELAASVSGIRYENLFIDTLSAAPSFPQTGLVESAPAACFFPIGTDPDKGPQLIQVYAFQ